MSSILEHVPSPGPAGQEVLTSGPERIPAVVPSRRPSLVAAVVLLVTMTAGLYLRGFRLGDYSYWYDESFSWKLTTFPVGELLDRLGGDVHPPLYFLILKLWGTVFGDSPTALRSLSVCFGLLTIAGTYLMVREAYRPQGTTDRSSRYSGSGSEIAALLAAGLVSLSTFQIHWSTQVRMYSLATACAVWSTWALLRALRAPRSTWRDWLPYTVMVSAFLYTHYFAMFTIFAQIVYATGVLAGDNHWSWRALVRDPRLTAWLISLWLALTAWSPWLPMFLTQRQQVQSSFWIGRLEWRGVANSLYQMFLPAAGLSTASEIAVLLLAAALALGLAWRARSGDWLLLLCGFLPFVMAVAVSLWDTKVFVTHYLLCAHVFLLAGITVLLARIEPVGLRLAAIAALVGHFLWVDLDYLDHRSELADLPGAKGAVAFVDAERQAGEIVVSCCPMLTPTLEGHSRMRRDWRTLTRGYAYPHFQGTAVIRPGEYISLSDLQNLDADRVWIIEEENWAWGKWPIEIPAHWRTGPAERFADIYGEGNTVVVRLFYPSNEKRDRQATTTPNSG